MTRGNGIKVVVSMIGLDSHTTGAEVVTTLLRDAGFEVVYLGVNQTPDMILNAAVQEDADIVGISSHASAFILIEDLLALAEERGLSDIPVVVGGHVPPHNAKLLLEKGVAKVFPPGSAGDEIVGFMAELGRKLQAERAGAAE